MSERRRPMACGIIGLTAAFVMAAWPVQAAETGARGAVTGEGWLNTDMGATVVDARVDFEVEIDLLTFGGAYRAYDPGDGAYNPAGIDPIHDLKHRYIEARVEGLFVRAGHFFSTFGRGLSLRSFEDVDLEHDTALDGVTAEYAAGPFMVTGLAGVMTERLTGFQAREHAARGIRVKTRFGDLFSVAMSALDRNSDLSDERIQLPDSVAKFNDDVLGADLEMWMGPVWVVAEHAYRDGGYYHRLEQEDQGGHGTYISGTLSTTGLTLLGEYKDYDRLENALISPPICVKEHIWTLMNRVTHQVDLDNERGFLLEGALSAIEGLQITGGASEARTQAGGLSHWEIFGQVDQTVFPWGVKALAGSWSREYISGKFTQYVSGAADVDLASGDDRIVEIAIEAQIEEDPSSASHENYLGTVAFYPRPDLTLAVSGELTTEEGAERASWVFGEIGMAVAGNLEVSLGAGAERGGKKCSGGICYTEPEFEGVRLRFSAFF